MTEPKVETITLTPQLAKELLSANTRNRSLRVRAVTNLAEAIRRGEWVFDGSPIRLSRDGVLLDGQHRCAAVVEAGIAVPTVLITGLGTESQIVMDSGRARRFSDYLRIQGVGDYNNVASVTRLLWNYNHGVLGWRGDWNRRPEPTYQQLMDNYHEYGEIISIAVQRARTVRREVPANNTAAATAYMLFALIDNDDADDFFDKFAAGINLPDRHPVLALRRQLFNRERKTNMNAEYQLALIIKAWNFYRDGKSIQNLVYRPGGQAPEAFPEPH